MTGTVTYLNVEVRSTSIKFFNSKLKPKFELKLSEVLPVQQLDLNNWSFC